MTHQRRAFLTSCFVSKSSMGSKLKAQMSCHFALISRCPNSVLSCSSLRSYSSSMFLRVSLTTRMCHHIGRHLHGLVRHSIMTFYFSSSSLRFDFGCCFRSKRFTALSRISSGAQLFIGLTLSRSVTASSNGSGRRLTGPLYGAFCCFMFPKFLGPRYSSCKPAIVSTSKFLFSPDLGDCAIL